MFMHFINIAFILLDELNLKEKIPRTAAEWESFPFCSKMHWGFYTWPKELITSVHLTLFLTKIEPLALITPIEERLGHYKSL